jgi:hypothetical protein
MVFMLGASFAENFYGLKRRRKPWVETERARAAVGGIPAGDKLEKKQITRSLFFLVSTQTLWSLWHVLKHAFERLPYLIFEQRPMIILKSSEAV